MVGITVYRRSPRAASRTVHRPVSPGRGTEAGPGRGKSRKPQRLPDPGKNGRDPDDDDDEGEDQDKDCGGNECDESGNAGPDQVRSAIVQHPT